MGNLPASNYETIETFSSIAALQKPYRKCFLTKKEIFTGPGLMDKCQISLFFNLFSEGFPVLMRDQTQTAINKSHTFCF